MQSDLNIIRRYEDVLENSLFRFRDRISRLEVHLSDENGSKKVGPNGKRCMLEARAKGLQPVAVTDEAAHLDLAVAGAADNMKHALETIFGKMNQY